MATVAGFVTLTAKRRHFATTTAWQRRSLCAKAMAEDLATQTSSLEAICLQTVSAKKKVAFG